MILLVTVNVHAVGIAGYVADPHTDLGLSLLVGSGKYKGDLLFQKKDLISAALIHQIAHHPVSQEDLAGRVERLLPEKVEDQRHLLPDRPVL